MVQLQADSLTKRYGKKPVLHDISFSYSGSVLGIAGANGSGKTTLLKCLTGLLKPSSGSVTWKLGGNILNQTDLKSHIGYAAPYIQLYEELTVLENLQFLCDLGNSVIAQDLNRHLRRYEAGDFEKSLYGNLSTGQQQRVKLAACTVKNPTILILDEPGSNLDTEGRELVERMVDEHSKDGKMTIIASNQSDELKLCKKIIDLN
jgi:heme ABC exporter ATP-binding subunit CcmA